MVLKVERVLYIHSPHLQLLLARGLNSQSFDYESDSLTIRPRLPQSEFTAEHWRIQNDTHLVEYSVAASHRRRRSAAAPRSPLGRRGWAQGSWGPGWGLEGPWCRWVEGRWWRGCRETSGCWLQRKWLSTGPELHPYSSQESWGTASASGWGKRCTRGWRRTEERRTCETDGGICCSGALRSRGLGLWRRKAQGTCAISIRWKQVNKCTTQPDLLLQKYLSIYLKPENWAYHTSPHLSMA